MIYQFRYQKDDDSFSNTTYEKMFESNNLFSIDNNTQLTGITQLGVQALPGTQLFINGISGTDDLGIIVNWTGIFEIDLSDIGGTIESLKILPAINDEGINLYQNPGNKIIVDVLYNKISKGGNK